MHTCNHALNSYGTLLLIINCVSVNISVILLSFSATNRWRRLPPEYASTSEDEFGSNRNSPKHIRMRPGTTLRTSRLGGPSGHDQPRGSPPQEQDERTGGVHTRLDSTQ